MKKKKKIILSLTCSECNMLEQQSEKHEFPTDGINVPSSSNIIYTFRALKDKFSLFSLVWKRNIHASLTNISILTLYTKQPEPQVLNILEPVYTQMINSKMSHYCTCNLYLFIPPPPSLCLLSNYFTSFNK